MRTSTANNAHPQQETHPHKSWMRPCKTPSEHWVWIASRIACQSSCFGVHVQLKPDFQHIISHGKLDRDPENTCTKEQNPINRVNSPTIARPSKHTSYISLHWRSLATKLQKRLKIPFGIILASLELHFGQPRPASSALSNLAELEIY